MFLRGCVGGSPSEGRSCLTRCGPRQGRSMTPSTGSSPEVLTEVSSTHYIPCHTLPTISPGELLLLTLIPGLPVVLYSLYCPIFPSLQIGIFYTKESTKIPCLDSHKVLASITIARHFLSLSFLKFVLGTFTCNNYFRTIHITITQNISHCNGQPLSNAIAESLYFKVVPYICPIFSLCYPYIEPYILM